MERRPAALLAVAALALVSLSCHDETPAGPVVIVTPTQTLTITAPGTGATPTPSSSGGKFASVRVGIFAQSCPGGGSVPNNATNTIRVGCIGTFTATPRDASGRELTLPDSAWSAMSVVWTVAGGACLDLDAPIGGNPQNHFNRQVRGEAPGTCAVCAVVDGIGACAVQPDGDRSVKVVP